MRQYAHSKLFCKKYKLFIHGDIKIKATTSKVCFKGKYKEKFTVYKVIDP